MSTGLTGEVNWTPSLLDYDVSRFFRGKQVTNEEFNELFLQQLYQGNYITDSLAELFKTHLGTAIYRTFTHTFDLKKSYTKVFTPAEWGAVHEDGYYYISIPAEEHGFLQTGEASAVDNMNVDTEMYVLDSDGQFHEVMQVEVDTDNTIHLYTDDNTLSGFVVVRSNDKSFRLAEDVEIDASDVKGLHPVAVSGRYQDLDGINDPGGPVPLINKNAEDILKIIEGPTVVNRAETAGHSDTTNAVLLDGTIQGIPVSNIFETGSNYVKDATHAVNADNAINAVNSTNAINAIQKADGSYAKFTKDSNGTLKADGVLVETVTPLLDDTLMVDGTLTYTLPRPLKDNESLRFVNNSTGSVVEVSWANDQAFLPTIVAGTYSFGVGAQISGIDIQMKTTSTVRLDANKTWYTNGTTGSTTLEFIRQIYIVTRS
jgi:hypothetical protein